MTLTCVVDRIEGPLAVVITDAGAVHEVALSALPQGIRGIREGAVLQVPTVSGVPQWARATRDVAEEQRRKTAAQARLDALRRGDPGGDVVL